MLEAGGQSRSFPSWVPKSQSILMTWLGKSIRELIKISSSHNKKYIKVNKNSKCFLIYVVTPLMLR